MEGFYRQDRESTITVDKSAYVKMKVVCSTENTTRYTMCGYLNPWMRNAEYRGTTNTV